MTPADEIAKYFAAGARAGCPYDQMFNFARAGIILHPKQLVASSAARACDDRLGPMDIGFGGARGGGKSFWMLAQIAADDCQRYPGLKCLILRKIGKANKENFADLRQRTIMSLPHDYREREGIVTFDNKSKIILGHFKDESEIDNYLGLEYDVIGTEEDTTLSVRKKNDIMTCLRSSKAGWRPRRYRTTNPGGISHANFKKEFITPWREGRESDRRFIQSLATDNPSLNPEYVEKILGRLAGWQRRAWLEGDWDIESGQYFSNFRHEVHVKPRSAITDIPNDWDVWCALDHGLTHYTMVYLLARDGDGNIWVLDEHGQRNWVPEQHAHAVLGMLGRWNLEYDRLSRFVAGKDCFDTRLDGDAIGTIAAQYQRFGITLTRANIDRVSGALEIYRRLGNEGTRSEGEAELRPTLFILETCPMLIECLPSLQRDPKHPEDVDKVDCDPDTGEGGDDCFVAGTPILTEFGDVPVELVRPGDMVLTREGLRPVVDVWVSRKNARVLRMTTDDGRVLVGTPNHPVFVQGKGFVRLAELQEGDILVSSWQNPNLSPSASSSTGSSSEDTRTPAGDRTVSITGRVAAIARRVLAPFTSRSGSPSTAKCPQVATFTTRTATHSTTLPTTSNASRPQSTPRNTSDHRSDWLRGKGRLSASGLWRQPGILPTRGERGTQSTEDALVPRDPSLIINAIDAARTSSQRNQTRDSVTTTARWPQDERPRLTASRRTALFAGSDSRPIDSSPQRRAPARVATLVEASPADTFAIHVADVHEYYANGILVHNCYDALRYGIMCYAAAMKPTTNSSASVVGPPRDFASYRVR